MAADKPPKTITNRQPIAIYVLSLESLGSRAAFGASLWYPLAGIIFSDIVYFKEQDATLMILP